MVTWPSSLPLPIVETQGRNRSQIIRSELESGRAFQRKVTDSKFEELTARFVMTHEQFQIFKIWYSGQITDGADWFYIELDLDGITQQYTVRIIEGLYQYSKTDSVVALQLPLEIDLN